MRFVLKNAFITSLHTSVQDGRVVTFLVLSGDKITVERVGTGAATAGSIMPLAAGMTGATIAAAALAFRHLGTQEGQDKARRLSASKGVRKGRY